MQHARRRAPGAHPRCVDPAPLHARRAGLDAPRKRGADNRLAWVRVRARVAVSTRAHRANGEPTVDGPSTLICSTQCGDALTASSDTSTISPVSSPPPGAAAVARSEPGASACSAAKAVPYATCRVVTRAASCVRRSYASTVTAWTRRRPAAEPAVASPSGLTRTYSAPGCPATTPRSAEPHAGTSAVSANGASAMGLPLSVTQSFRSPGCSTVYVRMAEGTLVSSAGTILRRKLTRSSAASGSDACHLSAETAVASPRASRPTRRS